MLPRLVRALDPRTVTTLREPGPVERAIEQRGGVAVRVTPRRDRVVRDKVHRE